ncbi:MAG TPA: bile acid:sodium symporter family protein, partial [Nannocystis exedens]|nr:bile acid:sodium symporter family protein [Nannocystis exedens]
LLLLNAILGLIMFGVALDLKIDDFRRVLRQPRAVLIGLVGQLALLPALTFGLVVLLEPQPSIGLGMLIVASCPGGNVSNVITHLGGGSTGVSITMTAITTLTAIVMTPFNLAFWGARDPGIALLLTEVELSFGAMVLTIALILGLPLLLGMVVSERLPTLAARLRLPMRRISMFFLAVFIVGALAKNWSHFLAHVGGIVGIVALHNASAFGLGNLLGRAGRLSRPDRRALTIEIGIQNSGLGLVLIFSFFGGLGGAALIAAWWGVWHLLAGLTIAAAWAFWSNRLGEAEEGSK